MYFERYVAGAYHRVGTLAPPPGTFTYVVGVYDGTALSLFVNGSEIGSPQPDSRDTIATGIPLHVGSDVPNGKNVFEGVVDEFAVYDYALLPARIAAHFAAASML
jgi:hypothetical protein